VVTAVDGPASRGETQRLVAGESLGRYVVIELLGAGGMGEVYAAYDPKLDRRIAIKLMNLDGASDAARLEKEGRALARVTHSNVVTVHDVGGHGDDLFVAMEFVQGMPLSEWLVGRPPWRRCLEVFAAAGRGVAAAHDAGVVHRDFKPSNVMLEPGGRVVVLDFGLARLGPATPSGLALDLSSSADEASTRSAVGTPAYMAPEQLEGDPVNEASDQFAYAVSLFEALHGRRPFTGRDLLELLACVREGVTDPAGGDGVPVWLDRVVYRGLSMNPADRFPSMDAFVDALEAGRDQRQRRIWVGVGLCGAVGLGVIAVRPTAPRAADADCIREAGEAMDAVWSPPRADQLTATFDASGRPHAHATAARVRQRVHRYTERWRTVATEACAATLVRESASRQTLNSRQACLKRHRIALTEALVVLSEAKDDPSVVDKALTVVGRLEAPSTCVGPHPVDAPAPEQQGAIDGVIARTARARARRAAGHFTRALAQVDEAIAEAEPLGSTPARADALLERAEVQLKRAEYTAVQDDLARALAIATELELPRRQTKAAMSMMLVHGGHLGNYDDARRWMQVAEASARRLHAADPLHARLVWFSGTTARRRGDAKLAESRFRDALHKLEDEDPDPLVVAGLVLDLGITQLEQARHDEARASMERALALRTEALGPQHPGVADTLEDLAALAGRQGRNQEAIALGLRALAIYETGVDPAHPNVGTILNNLGLEYYNSGRNEDALQTYDRSLAVREAALGPSHQDVAETLTNRGWSLFAAGRHQDARADLERAIAIITETSGEFAPGLASALGNLGNVSLAMGDVATATQCAQRALSIAERSHGAKHPSAGVAHHNIGDLLADTGRCQDAVAHFERAIAIFDGANGPDHPSAAYPLTSLGRCHVKAGRAAQARVALRRAYEIRSQATVPSEELGKTAMALSRALWADPDTQDQARPIANRGIKAYEAAGASSAQSLAQARAWLADELTPDPSRSRADVAPDHPSAVTGPHPAGQ